MTGVNVTSTTSTIAVYPLDSPSKAAYNEWYLFPHPQGRVRHHHYHAPTPTEGTLYMPAPYLLTLQPGVHEILYYILHTRIRQWECQITYLEEVSFLQSVTPEVAPADALAFDQNLLRPQTADIFTSLNKDRRLLYLLDSTLHRPGASFTKEEVLDLVALCQRRTQNVEIRETLVRLQGKLYALLCP